MVVWRHFLELKKGNMTRTFNAEDFPSNTVGVTYVVNDKAEFSYFRGHGKNPFGIFNHAPLSMIGLTGKQRDSSASGRKDGQLINGKLWVGLVLIVESENMFDTLGVDYALIEEFMRIPINGRSTISESCGLVVFSATALAKRTDIYIPLRPLSA